jgi:DNA polymerase III subunit delta'
MLIGHEEQWHEWRGAMTSERMHHAWILTGKQGLGKASFARMAAAELVAESGIAQPDPLSHPDIIVLEALPANDDEEKKRAEGKPYQTKRNISVDQIRRMQQRLHTRPTLGARRAVIIDPADELEKSSVNALLKSLEEPPVGTFFLLVSHRIGRLLPTVRSRCRLLTFAPLSDGQVARLLEQAAPDADASTRAAAVAAAQGSPGHALAFVEQDLGVLHDLMSRLLNDGDADLALRGALGLELGAKPTRERVQAVFDLARAMLAAHVGAASRERQARIIEVHQELAVLASQAPTYNFDPGLLAVEIGGLLASAALPREAAPALRT